MKQLPTLVLLILCSYNLSSQQYVPMAVDSATWFMVSTLDNPALSEFVVVRIEGDTVVNNKTYSKIYHYIYDANSAAILNKTRKLLGLLRDDLADRKVYGGFLDEMQVGFETFVYTDAQCNWGDSNSFNEHMLYDFGLQVGDTIVNCMYPESFTVESIATKEKYGFQRRNLVLDENSNIDMTEGIGSCIGIFRGQQCFLTGGGFTYYLSNYCIGSFANCNLVTSIEESSFSNRIVTTPNPVSDIQILTTDLEIEKTILLDLNGRLIASYKRTNQIDMSGLSSGLYILTLLDNKGSSYSQKVIKN